MSEALERRSGRPLELEHFTLGRYGLRVKGNPTLDDWAALGQLLAEFEGGMAWLVGDWLNTGEERFGELAAQAIDHEEWAAETVRVYRWVASRVPQTNRPLGSFAHCQVVAALPVEEQKTWLDRARRGDEDLGSWSSGRLKQEIAAKTTSTVLLYMLQVEFDQPADRDAVANEHERAGRKVRRYERGGKRDEL